MLFSEYKKPSITVDTVLFRCIDVPRGLRKGDGKELQVLLIKRNIKPFKDKWSLPGGFMSCDSGRLMNTAKSKLEEKAGIKNVYLEQLMTFDMLDRDPRDRVLSVAYLGLTHTSRYECVEANSENKWFKVTAEGLVSDDYNLNYEDLAFDHGEIIKEALSRLKNKIEYTHLVFKLLPDKFTVKEVQQIFEVIEGHKTDSFRRKLGNKVIETDEIVQRIGKPAHLFIENKEE